MCFSNSTERAGQKPVQWKQVFLFPSPALGFGGLAERTVALQDLQSHSDRFGLISTSRCGIGSKIDDMH